MRALPALGLVLGCLSGCLGGPPREPVLEAISKGDIQAAIEALEASRHSSTSAVKLKSEARALSDALIRRLASSGPRVSAALALDPKNPVRQGEAARLQNAADVLAWSLDLAGAHSKSDNILMAAEGECSLRFTRSSLHSAFASTVAAADLDGDGLADIVLNGSVVLRNGGGGQFIEVPGLLPVPTPEMPPTAALVADLDADGRADFLQLCGARLRLLLQEPGGTFRDATQGSGLENPFASGLEGAGLADVDADGRTDLYVAGYHNDQGGDPDRLYRNLGGGRFADETGPRGLTLEKARAGRAVTFGDIDTDGWIDLFVGNYRLQPNSFWHNMKGTFTDRAEVWGIKGEGRTSSLDLGEDAGQKYWGHTIGGALGDVDNDQDLDLLVGNLAHPDFISFSDPSQLFINPGKEGRWQDVFSSSGLRYAETHSDVSFADADNDGDLDVYFTAIYPHRPSHLFLNRLMESGSLKFEESTWHTGVLAFDTWGHAWLDADDDGDLDLVVAGRHSGLILFLSGGVPGHGWCRVSPEPALPGTRVTVTAGDRVYVREITAGRGITSQDEPVAHVGLGSTPPTSLEIEVRWPDGTTRKVFSAPRKKVVIRR